MANYLVYCPYFLDSDILALHKDIFIKDTRIIDRSLGLQHEVRPQAAAILKLLSQNVSYKKLRRSVSQIPSEQLHELLGFLTATGSLERKRNSSSQIIAFGKLLQDMSLGIRHMPLLKRLPLSISGIVKAICKAGALPIVCGSILIFVWSALHVNTVLISDAWYVFALFWLSLIAHEIAHGALLVRYSAQSVIVFGPLRAGIVHSSLPRTEDIKVALAGPLAGILVCSIATIIMFSVKRPGLAIACLSICAVHIGSFLPWYGDGKTIWNKRRKYEA